MDKGATYFLGALFNKEKRNHYEFLALRDQIERIGFFTIDQGGKRVKVYTPELAFVLCSKNLTVTDRKSKSEISISGFYYIDSFVEGFTEGEASFAREFAVSPEALYSSKSENYVRDLHANYFHTGFNEKGGWNYVKKQYSLLLSVPSIREFGHFSGIVSCVDSLIKKHPVVFSSFKKCTTDSTSRHPKPIKNPMPTADIEKYRTLLIKGKVLTEAGESENQIGHEKFKAKPIIALLIKDLASQYQLPEISIFKSVKAPWNLKSPDLKHYKLPAKKDRRGDYEGYLDSLLS